MIYWADLPRRHGETLWRGQCCSRMMPRGKSKWYWRFWRANIRDADGVVNWRLDYGATIERARGSTAWLVTCYRPGDETSFSTAGPRRISSHADLDEALLVVECWLHEVSVAMTRTA